MKLRRKTQHLSSTQCFPTVDTSSKKAVQLRVELKVEDFKLELLYFRGKVGYNSIKHWKKRQARGTASTKLWWVSKESRYNW